MSLEVNRRSLMSISKPLSPDRIPAVEAGLKRRRDGADSLGVQTVDGQTRLVLTRTAQTLSTTSQVRINGQPAKVLFTENEANSAREGALKAMSSKVVPVAIAGLSAVGAYLSFWGNPGGGIGLVSFLRAFGVLLPVAVAAVLGTAALVGGVLGHTRQINLKVSDRVLTQP